MRDPNHPSLVRAWLLSSTALFLTAPALAQQAPAGDAQPAVPESADRVVVVGSQIAGARPSEALPVTVLDEDDIDAIAASSGDELFRSIPQLGDVAFNTTRTIGSLNDARGDTASINLRALGTGNTLVLLNGRRMINHPGTQAENLVPVVTVNANAIPTSGVRRIEVLLDGASAIYGADAVAGVVNTVLKDSIDGLTAELTFGGEEGVAAEELAASFEYGIRSADDRTRLSLLGSYLTRDPVLAAERPFTANADLRSRLPADWRADATASAGFNNTSLTSAWGVFDRFSSGAVAVGTTTISNSSGQFHLRPASLSGCALAYTPGLCFGSSSTRPQESRYNVNGPASVSNGVERFNLFAFLNHDFDGGLSLFAEAGGYLAESLGYREAAPLLGSVPIVIPASNFYNPFGPAGSPNRLPGYTGPGLDLVLGSLTGTSAYRPVDAGPRRTEVENLSGRALLGLRGEILDWRWESALLYTNAETQDSENRVSNTLFQAALARNTADAYNPFNGGCLTDFAGGDCTPSERAAIDSFTVQAARRSQTSLASWDLKLSRPDLLSLWAGDVGAAIGLEARRETFRDDRDPRQDGSIVFDDIISTAPVTNDLQGNSASLDTRGSRTVAAGYAELQVPLVAPDMNIPFIRSADLQMALRVERFDTFGSVTRPKLALSLRPFDWMLVRSAWSEGFRAPNLQQQYETGLQRSNIRTDFIRCEAAVRKARAAGGAVPAFTTACPSVTGASQSVISNRKGSSDLRPESSSNLTYGFVFDGAFLPPEWGELTVTADWWRIEQDKVVGIFGDDNHILLDYVLRLNNGSNPAVVRAAPDAQDVADFSGSGLAPVGDILFVDDTYLNLDERTVQGWDFGVYYSLEDTPFGSLSLRLNAALLDKFFQGVSSNGAIINAAAAAGQIPSVLRVNGQGDLVRNFGRPEWRYSGSLTWRLGPWGAGWFTSFVGDVEDRQNVLTATGRPWIIDDFQTHNVYLQYEFAGRAAAPTRVRVGLRNMFGEVPPLADTSFGYLGDLHTPQGRFAYVNIRQSF
jgi:outer membrane receptor protein involved in Fe transport